MYASLGQWISRGWPVVILGWIGLAAFLQFAAPAWDKVTLDGDFAYLPNSMGSVQAETFFNEAYPDLRPRSQIVLVVARREGTLTSADDKVADELSLPFLNALAAVQIERAREFARKADEAKQRGSAQEEEQARLKQDRALEKALQALEESLVISERNATALHNRSLVFRLQGKTAEADDDRAEAIRIDPALQEVGDRVTPAFAATLPFVDVWTRHTQVVGSRLVRQVKTERGEKADKAVLIVIQLSTEFMAAQNIGVLEWIKEIKARDFDWKLHTRDAQRLEIGITGSAAVGADMLASANESLHSTELLTTVLVIAILLLVYRAPLLVAVPMLTIVLSYLVATAVVAALTQLGTVPGFDWWTFKVFKTTRIFIVVILYGSGTDFCLFLIARYKEELAAGKDRLTAMIESLANVGDALTASACTTIFGLSMMLFAEYGKFANSGPAIAVCLVVTLLACLTFAPALILAMGSWVFWPFGITPAGGAAASGTALGETAAGGAEDSHAGTNGRASAAAKPPPEPLDRDEDEAVSSWWQWTADVILARPGLVMVATLLVMVPVAYYGLGRDVSYDFLHELSPQRSSVVGIELLKAHFPVGEVGPVSILARLEEGEFDQAAGLARIEKLTAALWTVHGVQSVRSLAEPLGDPPGKASFVTAAGRMKLAMRRHRLTREIFLARAPHLTPKVARFDVLLGPENTDPPELSYDPFSVEARHSLAKIVELLNATSAGWGEGRGAAAGIGGATAYEASGLNRWAGAKFYVAGTTASIRDLAEVTERDSRNIQIYVVVAVFLVLMFILRDFVTSVYMMGSVLLSYYFTMGVTIFAFPLIYGPTYTGMDWKVPLFLFVILVAIGQDYNIYLVTRVFEERLRLGPREGLRSAIRSTGAIITSCGLIMAGSFVSMTTGTLRAISELGFTLTFGILLDTFVVRTLLLPAFLALGVEDTPADEGEDDAGPAQQETLREFKTELVPSSRGETD